MLAVSSMYLSITRSRSRVENRALLKGPAKLPKKNPRALPGRYQGVFYRPTRMPC
jgi:hypothetical protein